MKRPIFVRLLAVCLALAMPLTTMTFVLAQSEDEAVAPYDASVRYQSPNVNQLSGIGQEPQDLSVTAGAQWQQKAWYEFVTYNDKAVASYRLSDTSRLVFYDPYTYTNSMVMSVKFDATTTEFDTMSSYTISKTNTKSIIACVQSTDTYTDATQTSGKDVTHTDVTNGGYLKTTYNHNENVSTTGKVTDQEIYYYDQISTLSETIGINSSIMEGVEIGLELGGVVEVTAGTSHETTYGKEWLTSRVDHETIYDPGYKTTTTYDGTEDVEDHTTSKTEGWTQLSARVTKTLGSSRSTSNSWSEEESVTVTKTYAATHFASDGVTPLPWAIVHYEVQMPMKVSMQVLHSGEWITISTAYCLLTTVKGTCRAWMQNAQVYYEDWGSGEPVVASDFWSQFMTKEKLVAAYTNKLYPVGG